MTPIMNYGHALLLLQWLLPMASASTLRSSFPAQSLIRPSAPATSVRMCSSDESSSVPDERDPDAAAEDDTDELSSDEANEFSSSIMSVLSARLAAAKQKTSEERLQSMMAAAANWRSGRCAQRAVVVLDEWIRRLDCQDGVLACGTYSGDVHLVDVESGDLLDTWLAEQLVDDDDDDDVDQEITAIQLSEDAERVVSGDEAGYVLLRQRGAEDPLLRASHGAPVSGVHWDAANSRVYSSGMDNRFLCHHVDRGGEL